MRKDTGKGNDRWLIARLTEHNRYDLEQKEPVAKH